jgi:TRAP-type C4-dicarboxylate transport system permease large subunit
VLGHDAPGFVGVLADDGDGEALVLVGSDGDRPRHADDHRTEVAHDVVEGDEGRLQIRVARGGEDEAVEVGVPLDEGVGAAGAGADDGAGGGVRDGVRFRSGAPERGEAMPLGAILRGTLQVWPLAVMIVAVLGSLFAGIATPTEAAAVGVAAVIVLGFTMGELTPAKLVGALVSTTRTFAVVGVVFLGAVVLAQAISLLGLPQQMLEFVVSMGLSKYAALLIVVVIYLVLGCFFDGLSMMIMTLPIVFPLLTGLGFDPIWLGVVITVMIEVGMLTPPVGMNLFVLVGLTGGEVQLGPAARASVPYWLALLLGVLLMTIVPGIATWLPAMMRI